MTRYTAQPFDLEIVRTLIEAHYSFIQIRAKLKCNNNRLRAYMTDNGLTISEEANRLSNERKQQASRRARASIDPGHGGDEAFRELMAGRSFSRMVFASDNRAPIHLPHRIPGDDFSISGSSSLHSVGGRQ